MKQKIMAMLVAILAILPALASPHVGSSGAVKIDGLYYKILGDKAYYSCEISEWSPEYLVIPPQVEYGGKTYPVVGFVELTPNRRYNEEYEPLLYTTKIFLPETIVNNSDNFSWLRKHGGFLEQIEVSKKSTELSSLDGVLYDGTGETLLLVPRARKTALTMFPSNLKVFGSYSYRSRFLESVAIPEGVTTIEDYAFSGSPVKEIVMPNSVSSIGPNAFNEAEELKRVSFGKSLKELTELKLNKCPSLEEVSFSAGTTSINTSTFDDCTTLRRIVVADDNPAYSTYEGVLYDKGYKNLLYAPYGIYGFVAPAGFDAIPPHAFENRKSLSSADLTNIRSIGESAFSNANLLKIDLSGPAKEIEKYAFSGNRFFIDGYRSALEIILSDEMTEIPPVFQNCRIQSIAGYENIEAIAERAFAGSQFIDGSILDIIKNASEIEAGAFDWTKFPENAVIELSDEIEVVEDKTFDLGSYYNNSIAKLKIGPKVRRIGDAAFNIKEVSDGIYCEPDLPPVCTGEPFNNAIYAFTTLYVQTPEKYAATAPWNKFNNIVYHEYSRVEEVADGGEEVSVSCVGGEMRVECVDGTAVTVWSADGREAYSGTGSCIVSLPRGIYIVRAGSSTRKVIL